MKTINIVIYKHIIYTYYKHTWSIVWVAAVVEEDLEYLHWQQLGIWDFWLVLSLGDDNEVTNEGEIIGGGVLEIRWEMVEFLEVVIDLLRSLGLLTGFKCFSTAADRFEFVLLGVELLLTECRTGLTTLLKYFELSYTYV